MSYFQSKPGNFEHSRELEDPDLAPKPLRVVKRGSQRKLGNVDIVFAPSASSTQQTLIPTRSSSISSASTQIELSPLDSASARTSWSGRRGSIQTHKQRRSDPLGKSSTSANIRSGVSTSSTIYDTRGRLSHYRRMSDMIDSEAAQRSSSTRPTGSRAFTIGAFHTNYFLNPVNDEPLSLAPTPMATAGRRAMTAVAIDGQGGATEDNLGPVLPRQPSFKHRLITRMMGSLSHRSHIGHATNNGPGRNPLILENSSGSNTQDSEAMDSPVRTSSSSEGTDTLGSALASFPTPPTSNEASPTTSGSFSHPRLEPQRYRELCRPEETAIIGAELRLTAEYDEVSSDSGRSMLVAIDIEGTMNNTTSGQSLWSQHTGLDVAVVIDNSLFTSPNMLMASCETTRALASILNVVTDRMAVLCTSPINDHRTLGADFTRIWPLSRIKLQKLKTVLDAVVNTKEVPSTGSWVNTIESATELLLHSTVPDADAEILQDTFGLVIILTANAEGLPSRLLTHDKLHFHVICPASVPRSNFGAIDCNGWKLRSSSGTAPHTGRAQKDTDPTSLLNKLRALIMHARGGKEAGKLTYLSLDIKPGPKCRIESVMGKSEYLTLHPGELRTILVRLRVPAAKAQEHTLSRSDTLPALGQYSIDIQDELDRMLKVAPRPVKILTARLKYKHSLLPASTTCSVVAECSLKKRMTTPVEVMQPEKVSVEQPVKVSTMVHERLAYHLATHGSPEMALSVFRDEFGDEGWHSHCPDYTHLLLSELKYQARITERLEVDASPKKLMLPHTMSMDPTPDKFSGHPRRLVCNGENSRPDSWYTEVPDDDYDPSSPRGQLITLSDLKKATKPVQQMHAELEQARVLWDEMRKKSTGPYDLGKRRSVSSKLEEQHKKSLRQLMLVRNQIGNHTMAVPKQKSIKAAAMRRITSAGESLGKGLGGV